MSYLSRPVIEPSLDMVINGTLTCSIDWAAVNVFAGFAVFFWIITPALFYTNTWFTSYLPLCTADVYDRFGELYNTTRVITNNLFDQEKYAAYSPPYLPATFAFVYGLAFASITRQVLNSYLIAETPSY